MTGLNVLFLTKYGQKGASSRYRSLQYFPFLEDSGISCTYKPLFSDNYLNELYQYNRRSPARIVNSYLRRIRDLLKVHSSDVIVIEKELLPYVPAIFERVLSHFEVPYLVDYDDAIFHNYDKSKNPLIRRLFPGKIDVVMRNAEIVVTGNEYLSSRAQEAGASNIEMIPTVIDLDRYPYAPPEMANEPFTIGWIGSPSTAEYVEAIAPALKEVCDRRNAQVRLIGSGEVTLPGVPHQTIKWCEETEIDDLSDVHVGIMPLRDSFWERGKCGLKLIQYMGCWKPVVASPIGVNNKIVNNGKNGYLAKDHKEWIDALLSLCDDHESQSKLGQNGRQSIEEEYCLQVTAPRWRRLLLSLS